MLYRALRIRAQNAVGGDPDAGHIQDRPYPAGGAVHELEFYLTIGECDGLRPGVYAYDALRHELVPVASQPQDRCDLLAQAQVAAELEGCPPMLITVTARFGRVFWKYSSIGYRLVMQDTGVVLQTLYLVATAMGLGVCALGAVDIDRTARVLGLDWRVESGVGAMVLGRPRGAVPGSVPAGADPADAQWRGGRTVSGSMARGEAAVGATSGHRRRRRGEHLPITAHCKGLAPGQHRKAGLCHS
ncbi:SagB family peptide dehydrogenase [Catenulispora yoronensis]